MYTLPFRGGRNYRDVDYFLRGYSPYPGGRGFRAFRPDATYPLPGNPLYDEPRGRPRYQSHGKKSGLSYRERSGGWNMDRKRYENQIGRHGGFCYPGRRSGLRHAPAYRRRVYFPRADQYPVRSDALELRCNGATYDRERRWGHLKPPRPSADCPVCGDQGCEHCEHMWADPYEYDYPPSRRRGGLGRRRGGFGRRMQSPSTLSFDTEDLLDPYDIYGRPLGRHGRAAEGPWDDWVDVDDDEDLLDDTRAWPGTGFGGYGRRGYDPYMDY